MVGANPGENIGPTDNGESNCGSGLAAPGELRTYHLYTPHEGAFIINSYGATVGSEANGGNLGLGMFGALNVQPKGARIYRSQMTEEEMRLATAGFTDLGQPIVNYEAVYPSDGGPWAAEGKAGLPVVNMLYGPGCDTAGWTNCELVHSDINAIIAGPDADGSWRSVCPDPDGTKGCPYPLESVGKVNPQIPNRLDAFREMTSQYHDEQTNTQVFPNWYNNPVMSHVLHGVGDAFMINYGSGGIGSEIIANRLHTGPMHDCTDCAYEEFFLASQTVGDPALLVAFPAHTGIESCDPKAIAGPTCWRDPVNLANGPMPGNIALYQEDPSNVHHTYTGDHVKYRNTHAGAFEQHIFHFHNHQWLFNPNDDSANYLDAQEIMPGSGHTYELVNGGAGNRNHTVGDAIFHCHFYPHFAQGMWYHQRNHDVYETGTVLAVSDVSPTPTVENPYPAQKAPKFDPSNPGKNFHDQKWELRSGQPMARSRALPDGELADGSPIPAVIPLPGKPMPPMPAHVEIRPVDRGAHSLLGGRLPPDGKPDSSQAIVDRTTIGTVDNPVSPGYPFWLAGNECGPGIDPDLETGMLVGDECPQGIVGQRMPTPPLDMLTDDGAVVNSPHNADPLAVNWSNLGGGWDGGLPRHALLGYVSTGLSKDTNSRLDFRKVIEMAKPVYFPELGTDLEKISMAYQAVRHHPSHSYGLDGNAMPREVANPDCSVAPQPGDKFCKDAGNNDIKAFLELPDTRFAFVTNGAPAVPGGPYNDPCVDDRGVQLKRGHVGEWYDSDLPAVDEDRWTTLDTSGRSDFDAENPRTYKLANLQIDAVFNKVGYHYSQERIIILWDDVKPTIFKERPPEPLVMRFNTFDCGKILHANLVPHEFEVDDFQVRTPTDIIGQHIHLPKWDLTTNDGAANGWNYEDGTLAPGIVEERVHSINRFNGFVQLGQDCLANPNATWTDVLAKPEPQTFTCADFVPGDNPATQDIEPPGLAEGRAILKAGTLPGQLSDIELTDQFVIETLPNPCQDDPLTDCGTKGGLFELEAAAHPYFGTGGEAWGGQHYKGTRTTIQRILVDPVVNVAGVDRGLGLTFSHDHYGPSTFQQIGLYSTILAEPAGSTWLHNERGYDEVLGTRHDGGPTSWQAAILTPAVAPTGSSVQSEKIPDHREFYFEMSDFQHAYEADLYIGANANGVPILSEITQPDPFNAANAFILGGQPLQESWKQAVNPTLKLTANGGVNPGAFPDTVNAHPGCPGPAGQNDGNYPRPCPEAINIGHSSMWVVNYRNEPVGLRVFDPNKLGPDNKRGSQAGGWNENGVYVNPDAGDLALAFQSRGDRAISDLNSSFGNTPYPQASYCSGNGDGINCDRGTGDPFTPIMRAYMNDHVKVKIQVGATEEQHQTTIHGMKWLSNGSGFGRSGNSGWRNFQSHGISEQFTLSVPITQDPDQPNNTVDYLYATDATRDGIWSGTWGILRAYQNNQNDLFELPNNPQRGQGFRFRNEGDFLGVCRAELRNNGRPGNTPANLKAFTIYAVLANDVLGNDIITGNRTGANPDCSVAPQPGDGICLDADNNEIPAFVDVPDIQIPDNVNPTDNVGGTLNPDGGTLVYNRRATEVPAVTVGEGGEQVTIPGGFGPLHDPTAMMYVLEEDLMPSFIPGESPDGTEGADNSLSNPYPADGVDDRCQKFKSDGTYNENIWTAGCPVKLKPNVPVEPLVLRANAGDCIDVTLHNKLQAQAKSKESGYPVFTGTGKAIFSEVRAKKALDNNEGLRDTGNNTITSLAQIDFDTVPDLAGWMDTFWVVNRDLFKPVDQRGAQMSFFGNNLIRPSGKAGMVAQLVDYDSRIHQGIAVGRNNATTLAGPGEPVTYRYYAGDLSASDPQGNGSQTDVTYVDTPIEFGGTNLLSSDRIKQPQKGLFGALVIEPAGSSYDVDTLVPDGQGMGTATRPTRAQMTVTAPAGDAGSGGTYRETLAIAHKITNLRWADGSAIKNVGQPEFGVEGAEDSGHAGYNYGMEPSWFRFKLPPDVPSGAGNKVGGVAVPDGTYGSIPNPQAMYSNALVAGETNAMVDLPEGCRVVTGGQPDDTSGCSISVAGDPQTPVFRAQRDEFHENPVFDTRMFVLNGASADRDGTYILHGHVWQRDPHVCTGDKTDPTDRSRQDASVPIEGRCDPWAEVPSNALGLNKQAKYMGGEEGMGHVFAHWPILFDAGGTDAVPGDYLYRDYAPNGNRNGMFGILRVTGGTAANMADQPAAGGDAGTGGGGGGGGGNGGNGGNGKKK
jgi:hypothetical protein